MGKFDKLARLDTFSRLGRYARLGRYLRLGKFGALGNDAKRLFACVGTMAVALVLCVLTTSPAGPSGSASLETLTADTGEQASEESTRPTAGKQDAPVRLAEQHTSAPDPKGDPGTKATGKPKAKPQAKDRPEAKAKPEAKPEAKAKPQVKVEKKQRSICEAAAPAAALVGLSNQQGANAATIAAVARERGLPERAVVIALATAMQESKLDNLNYGDRDSLGLFQQRPSQGWGTPAQVTDPRYAAGIFYDHLVQVPGWQGLPLTVAAQAVQRSAFPDAYAQWEGMAAVLSQALVGASPTGTFCQ